MVRTTGFIDVTVNGGANWSQVTVYPLPAACPRCDRRAKDDREWRRWALEAVEEVRESDYWRAVMEPLNQTVEDA